jgi:beta-galactosidase/beta-glucuronidase
VPNFVRLCHYPHDPRTLDLCDEIGLLAMCEIPLYWWGNRDEDHAARSRRRQTDSLRG